MKAEFIDGLIKKMIDDMDFLPIKNAVSSLNIEGRISILSKNLLKKNIIVEILNADLFTVQEIRERMERNTGILSGLQKNISYYLFEVFVFDNPPDDEKFNSILKRQFQNTLQKKYLNSIIVDLSNKITKNLFSSKISDFNIGKSIESILLNKNPEGFVAIDIDKIIKVKEKEYSIDYQEKKSYMTYLFLGINILVFGVLFLWSSSGNKSYNELLSIFGAKDNIKIMEGEYWRFITPIFLHGDIMHLLFNSYALFILGKNAEKILGKFKFVFVYLLAGIFGNIVSFIFSTNSGIGASGSIFGLLGVMLFLGLMKPVLFKNYFGTRIIAIIVFNLFYGFSNGRIDNAAHIGGLIGGFLTTGIVFVGERIKWYTNKSMYILLTIAIFAFSINIGFNSNTNKALLKVSELNKYEENEEWSKVEILSEEILDLKLKNKNIESNVLISAIKAEAYLNKYNEAIEHCKELLSLDSQNGHYLLGQLYIKIGEYESAKQELLLAKEAGVSDENLNIILSDLEKILTE